jgi:hypothetical protein
VCFVDVGKATNDRDFKWIQFQPIPRQMEILPRVYIKATSYEVTLGTMKLYLSQVTY